MNKTGLALKMLSLLTSGRLIKISEIASTLEVTKRKVLELKDELEIADFKIESVRGPQGGYRLDLNRSRMLSILNISNEELNALKFVNKIIPDSKSEHFLNYVNVVNKVEAISKLSNSFDYEIIQPLNHNRLSDKENMHFHVINDAIKRSRKIKFNYKTLNAKKKSYQIEPYELYYYKGFWYVITYYEKYHKAYHYKLVRMNEVEVLDEGYKKSTQFKLCDFTGETSIFKGEKYELTLHIFPPSSIYISESNIAQNQEIIDNEDGTIIFKGTMEGKVEIISWLLSLGNHVKVLEPEEIKNEYIEMIKKMAMNY